MARRKVVDGGEMREARLHAQARDPKYWQQLSQQDLRLGRAVMEFGASTESRLKWLLAFPERPLRPLSDDDWGVLNYQLRLIAPINPPQVRGIGPLPYSADSQHGV